MSDKLLGQLEAAQRKVTQLEQQRTELIATQAQATQELETVVEEDKATAALARARVAGNKLVIVERDLLQARQAVTTLDRAILKDQIDNLDRQLELGREAMNNHIGELLDLAEEYNVLSLQRAALLERAGDDRFRIVDQLGARVFGGMGNALAALGWTSSVTMAGRAQWLRPEATKA